MRLIHRTAHPCSAYSLYFLYSLCFAQAPPAELPGTIPAKDFDPGPAAVDVRPIEGGASAVHVKPGEWLRYATNVQATGMYTIELRVAHETGMDPEIRILCDGADVTGTMTVPYTGGPQHWVTLTRPGVTLTAGRHILKLEFGGGSGFYLASIRATPGTLPQPGPKPDPAKWELVWGDEFHYTGKPDPTKWAWDMGGDGWGNKELEYYTDRPENARVEDGRLIIEVRHEKYRGSHYTSARLTTRGKRDFLYGRIEVSAKLPTGAGTWPAIWLLGTSTREPWPASGELDIMEHIGRNPGWIHGSAHSLKYYWVKGNQKTGITCIPDAQTVFHEYALEWYPDRLDFFVDNNKYLTVANEGTGREAWPFDQPEYLILNIAMGGGWGGKVDDGVLPARMEIQYVRVYRQR
jgi:beta-glucanase (GH16 family)